MDFSSSFNNSYHHHQQQQYYNRETNAAAAPDNTATMPTSSISDHVVVKIDGCDQTNNNIISNEATSECNVSRIWRESSQDFWEDNINNNNMGFVSHDIDKEIVQDSASNMKDQFLNDRASNNESHEVIRRAKIQHRASALLGRLKTKSRLMDPSPERPQKNSETIGLEKPSKILKKSKEDEEDDPLMDEDLPDEYRKNKINLMILIQWNSLFLILTALTCTLALQKWSAQKIWGLNLWKWEVLALVLICGRLVSGWVIRIVVFFIERNFLLRKKVLYFVYGVRKAVQNCCWLGLALLSWHNMFDNKVEGNNKFLWYVNKLMVCMLLATVLWLIKTLMVKVLASSFHVSAFFDRIQDSLFNQYVIKALSGPPLTKIPSSHEEHYKMIPEHRRGLSQKPSEEISFKISGSIHKKQCSIHGITVDYLHRLNPKNVSAWGMKKLVNIIRHGSLSTLEEEIMESTKNNNESATEIRSEYEAKVAARKIFRNVAKPGSKFIYLKDLMCFLREKEALKTMNFVEESPESEKISKASLKNWVVNAFRERKSLALTLNDTKTAVKNLHQMANVLVCIIILIISLITLGIATSKFLLFLSSQIVVVAFIFGNTCKTVFESIIFLFVIHPFDVGDRCEIDGVQMIVEEMNILSTVFLRHDNQKIMYPNSTLSTKPIHNYYRSPDMRESVDFLVHIATPPEKIATMKRRIFSYVESKKEHWYSNSLVVLRNLEDLQKMRMTVWITHRMNHQDMKERWLRRSLLVEEMIKIFREIDLEYRLSPLDINIRTMPNHLYSDTVSST